MTVIKKLREELKLLLKIAFSSELDLTLDVTKNIARAEESITRQCEENGVVLLASAIKKAVVDVIRTRYLEKTSGEGKARTYIVKKGDTLWAIANAFGVTVDALAAANGITNPDLIFPGQEFVIPKDITIVSASASVSSSSASASGSSSGSSSSVTSAGKAETYIVKPSDTLWSIATRFGVTVESLVAVNGITNVHQSFAGKALVIPKGTTSSSEKEPIEIADKQGIFYPIMVAKEAEIQAGNALLDKGIQWIRSEIRSSPYAILHYSRNILNDKELRGRGVIDANGKLLITSISELEDMGFYENTNNMYHIDDDEHQFNAKFQTSAPGPEVIINTNVDGNGALKYVTDSSKMGTYNYGGNPVLHFFC